MTPWESIDFVALWTKDNRERASLSQADVAERASELMRAAGGSRTLKQQSIDQLEKRAHKGVPDWFRFVKEVIDGAKVKPSMPAQPVPKEPDMPPSLPDDLEYIREVDIRFAMGDGRVAEDYPEVGLVPFNRNFRRALTSASAEQLFIARGDGDSMMPTLINDDMVLIDRSQNRVAQSDRIWALRIEDAGMIKRVRVVPGGFYELLSDNASVPPQTVRREEVAVIGRVIWVGRRL